jgi:hypothetical protein
MAARHGSTTLVQDRPTAAGDRGNDPSGEWWELNSRDHGCDQSLAELSVAGFQTNDGGDRT